MLPVSRLIIRMALPNTMPLLYRATVSTGLAAAIHHQTLSTLALTLFRTLKNITYLNISFIHNLLPKGFKIDLIHLRRVLISAVIAKLARYCLLGTFWIPFRGTIIEIILNELAGNTSSVKSVLKVLNQITLPWLQEVNNLLQWIITNSQPISDWNINVAWIPAIIGITTVLSYFWWFPDSPFSLEVFNFWNGLRNFFNTITFGLFNKFLNLISYPIGGGLFIIKKAGSLVRDLGLFGWNSFRSFCRWIGGNGNGNAPQLANPVIPNIVGPNPPTPPATPNPFNPFDGLPVNLPVD